MEGIFDWTYKIGISSRVRKKGMQNHNYHIKQIDFDCFPNEQNLERVAEDLNDVEAGTGWVVFSGNSFHFYGRDVITGEEWVDFLNRLIAHSSGKSTIDKKFSPLSKMREYSILRVAGSYDKHEPQILFEVD